jgi:hypothetical protein
VGSIDFRGKGGCELVGNLRAIRVPVEAAMHLLPISLPTVRNGAHRFALRIGEKGTQQHYRGLVPQSHQMIASRRNCLAIARRLFSPSPLFHYASLFDSFNFPSAPAVLRRNRYHADSWWCVLVGKASQANLAVRVDDTVNIGYQVSNGQQMQSS